jgi:hypothetical protein
LAVLQAILTIRGFLGPDECVAVRRAMDLGAGFEARSFVLWGRR